MSQTRIVVTEDHTTTRLTVSPLGLQGAPGEAGAGAVLEITNSVANAAALPAVAGHDNEFWLAEDTGVIWYSNAVAWVEVSISAGGGGGGGGVSADAGNLLIEGTDDLPYASTTEITPAAIGAQAAMSAASKVQMETGTEVAILSMSPLLVRQGLDARLAAPPAIGSTTPAAGNFTSVYASDVRTGVLPSAINAGEFSGYAANTSTGNTNAVRGFLSSANHAGAGVAATVQGFKASALTTFAGKATELIGTDIEVTSYGNSSGYVTNMIGHDVAVYPHAYTTNSFGIRIAAINGLPPIATAYGLWIGDQSGVGTTASENIHSAGANSLNVFEGSLKIGGDLILGERADHASTPAAGHGYLWTKNTAPSTLVFTNDAGTDMPFGTAAGMDVGTDALDVVQLDATGKLPAVDGSLLTNLPESLSLATLHAAAISF